MTWQGFVAKYLCTDRCGRICHVACPGCRSRAKAEASVDPDLVEALGRVESLPMLEVRHDVEPVPKAPLVMLGAVALVAVVAMTLRARGADTGAV